MNRPFLTSRLLRQVKQRPAKGYTPGRNIANNNWTLLAQADTFSTAHTPAVKCYAYNWILTPTDSHASLLLASYMQEEFSSTLWPHLSAQVVNDAH